MQKGIFESDFLLFQQHTKNCEKIYFKLLKKTFPIRSEKKKKLIEIYCSEIYCSEILVPLLLPSLV